ncbi:hypothetical protein Pla111_22670 [Botrimarina hoheduenensis]|uniref:PEP-CTERM protein-sorting domain-containing protein n=1 Tax=Botrimarina hoheduenensis TaxID=2528000 RepID=A0A5C5VXH7_9BACT|nr:hypothetical protein Pla111_22670 [Botrimarina hoheduenensis]
MCCAGADAGRVVVAGPAAGSRKLVPRPPQGPTIDNSELNELLGLWGVGIFNPPASGVPGMITGTSSVPEPQTLLLALAALAADACRRQAAG